MENGSIDWTIAFLSKLVICGESSPKSFNKPLPSDSNERIVGDAVSVWDENVIFQSESKSIVLVVIQRDEAVIEETSERTWSSLFWVGILLDDTMLALSIFTP